MRVLHVVPGRLPAQRYGGIERVVWWLGKALAARGHQVMLLADKGTTCPFAEVFARDSTVRIESQIPPHADLVHFHHVFSGPLSKPYLVTIHCNNRPGTRLDRNSVFLSRDHAGRHGSRMFVYNGLDPDEYGAPGLGSWRDSFHFLGKAAWRVKNVRGAIRIARRAGVRLRVLGGYRLNLNMGFRLTLDRNVSFEGMVGGERKNRLLTGSRGLLFPVLWHEPFGLAVVESLYFGCPTIGTPFGALPELVPSEVGFLSDRLDDLVHAARNVDAFSRKRCHEWVLDNFTASRMASEYLLLYQRVLEGEALNASDPIARTVVTCALN